MAAFSVTPAAVADPGVLGPAGAEDGAVLLLQVPRLESRDAAAQQSTLQPAFACQGRHCPSDWRPAVPKAAVLPCTVLSPGCGQMILVMGCGSSCMLSRSVEGRTSLAGQLARGDAGTPLHTTARFCRQSPAPGGTPRWDAHRCAAGDRSAGAVASKHPGRRQPGLRTGGGPAAGSCLQLRLAPWPAPAAGSCTGSRVRRVASQPVHLCSASCRA